MFSLYPTGPLLSKDDKEEVGTYLLDSKRVISSIAMASRRFNNTKDKGQSHIDSLQKQTG